MILRFDTELGYKSLIKVFIFSNNILYTLVDLETVVKFSPETSHSCKWLKS